MFKSSALLGDVSVRWGGESLARRAGGYAVV
jgi:hypothetical protein